MFPLESSDAAAHQAPLDWPQPQHMNVVPSNDDAEPERCLITLWDRTHVRGTLVRVDFDAATLEFRPDGGVRKPVAFAAMRSLRLTRGVELEAIPGAHGGYSACVKDRLRKVNVEFRQGAPLELSAVSAVARRAGLFLFVPEYGGYVRWFIPAGVLAGYRVGEPALPEAHRAAVRGCA